MIADHHKQFHFQFLTPQIWATFNPADGQSSAPIDMKMTQIIVEVEESQNLFSMSQDAVIRTMCTLLWEHREHIDSIGGNSNSIEYIDEDMDLIEVAYFGSEPDGDYQQALADEGLTGVYTFADAFDLLHTRMANSGLFER